MVNVPLCFVLICLDNTRLTLWWSLQTNQEMAQFAYNILLCLLWLQALICLCSLCIVWIKIGVRFVSVLYPGCSFFVLCYHMLHLQKILVCILKVIYGSLMWHYDCFPFIDLLKSKYAFVIKQRHAEAFSCDILIEDCVKFKPVR